MISEILDRTPHHDVDSERALIGCIMLDPSIVPAVREALFTSDAIHHPGWRACFAIALAQNRLQKPLDTPILVAELKKRGQLDDVGGLHGLAEALNAGPLVRNWPEYAARIADQCVRRKAFATSIRLAQASHNGGATADMLSEAIADLTIAQHYGAADVAQDGPAMICMADVEARSVNWLWFGRVAAGRLTLIVGDPGLGKSFISADLAARISTGSPFPDGAECPQGSTILISAEDDPHDVIRPRLDAAYADVSKIHLLSGALYRDADGQQERMITLGDLPEIEEAIKRVPDCRLVVVDPVGSYLGSKVDTNKDSAVRAVLAPIAKLAEKYAVAFVVVVHRRKGSGKSADEMAMGSRGFVGIARTVWHLSKDQENPRRRLLLPGKNNLGPEGTGLAFEIGGEPARIFWERDPVEMTADDALAAESAPPESSKPGRPPVARDAAADWLADLLKSGGLEVGRIKVEADGAGFGFRTVQRAKDTLGIKPYRKDFSGGWWWEMPRNQDATTDTHHADILSSCHLGVIPEENDDF